MPMNSRDLYKRIEIETASNEKLVLLLLDGAITFLGQAKQALAEKRIEDTHNRLVRVQDIISELRLSLKMETGEIAQNLSNLYDFLYHRLIEANLRKDDKLIDDVIRLLEPIRNAWREAMNLQNGVPAMAAASVASIETFETIKMAGLDIRG